jgi:TetR/AcrR family transcriptional regulator
VATKAAILRAAERLFAEKGFSATSMRDLAEASGTSKALIHHHFGNKDDLYLAVKQAVMERYTEAQRPQLASDTDPLTFIVKGMRTLFEFYRQNPGLVRLGTWAQLEGTEARWPGDEELWRTVIDRTRKAQQSGIIRDDIDAAFLVTMAGALAHHWWEFKACRQHLLEYFPDQDERALDDQYLETMIEVYLRGVAGPGFGERGQQRPSSPSEEAS